MSLTHRQRQVLSLVAQGLTDKEIARRLGISTHTVYNHMSSIRKTLGGGTRVELVQAAGEALPVAEIRVEGVTPIALVRQQPGGEEIVVASGAVLPSGRVVIEWAEHPKGLSIYDSIQAMLEVHGRREHTRVAIGPS